MPNRINWTPPLIDLFDEALHGWLNDKLRLEDLCRQFSGPAPCDAEGHVTEEFGEWIHQQRLDVFEASVKFANSIEIISDTEYGLQIRIDTRSHYLAKEGHEDEIIWARELVHARQEELRCAGKGFAPWLYQRIFLS